MKRSLILLSLSLLVACGSQPTVINLDDVPNAVRAKRLSTPDCLAKGLVERVSGGNLANLRYVNQAPTLKAQASTDTLLDLLYETRKAINTNYYGFSTTDLQALHETYAAKFRAALGNLNAAIPTGTDPLMTQYLGTINDDHTYYLDAEQYKDLTDQGSGAPSPAPRFGFKDAPVPGENGTVLTDVDGDGPSLNVLSRGDVILAVGGQALGQDYAANSSIFMGAAKTGQAVTFSIRRDEKLLSVKVTPRVIEYPGFPTLGFAAPKVALLRVPTFNVPGVAQDVHDLVRLAQKEGATSLVLDLRDNGGGLVTEAVGVAGAFAPTQAGQKLETLDANDVTFAFKGNAQQGQVQLSGVCLSVPLKALNINEPALWTGKLATIVNADSASASEVVSNILRKTGAAAVGEATLGVGNTAINLFGLPGKRGLTVTIGRSRGLDGAYLPAKVTPDISAADDLKQLAHGRDLPLEAALAKVQ